LKLSMARWHCTFCGLATLAVISSGCAANRPGNPFVKATSPATTSQVAGAEQAASTDSPPRRTSPARETSLANPPPSAKGIGSAIPGAANSAATVADYDSLTAAFIDKELRDASPEERSSYLAVFQGMQPSAIRQVLQGRRMALNHELASKRGAGSVPVGHNTGYRIGPSEPNLSQNRAVTDPSRVLAGPLAGGPWSGAGVPQIQTAVRTAESGASTGARDTTTRPAVVSVGVPNVVRDGMVIMADGVATGPPSQAQLVRLISLAEAEAFAIQPGETDAQKQIYVKKQVDLRMLYLISGQQERALQAIPGIDPADQEFFQQTFWGLTNYFDSASIPSAADRATQTVAQMQNGILRLQEKANLELRNVAFCHKISSFGNYEKYPHEEFSPGQEVLVYAEVGNIHSEPTPDGKFRTNLKSTLEVLPHDSKSEAAERIDMPETVDLCRTHRRDYFHVYQFAIPTKLSAGPHVLKLTVEDQLSHRVTTYTLNFTVR
jgi:hypothetical protein